MSDKNQNNTSNNLYIYLKRIFLIIFFLLTIISAILLGSKITFSESGLSVESKGILHINDGKREYDYLIKDANQKYGIELSILNELRKSLEIMDDEEVRDSLFQLILVQRDITKRQKKIADYSDRFDNLSLEDVAELKHEIISVNNLKRDKKADRFLQIASKLTGRQVGYFGLTMPVISE
jgi:DNA-directed RNA polymerase subunit F